MTRIAVYPSDRAACGNLRLAYPAQALAAAGHDVVLNPFKGHHPVPIRLVSDGPPPHSPVVDVQPVEADVVVLQRPATRRLHDMIGFIRDQGIKVIVDVDDALWDIHSRNISHRQYQQPGNGPHWKWLIRSCQQADLVTSTTDPIREKLGGVVVPNCIPEASLKAGERKLDAWREDGPLVVGWAATSLTHPNDPKVTRGEVAEWIREQGGAAGFLSVGGRAGREPLLFGFLRSEQDAYFRATGEIPIGKWTEAVAALDVSLVPLEDTHFNHCKSSLKMLESAAAGCAVIVSPTPDNERLVGLGIGVIAKERRWKRRLNQIAASREQVRFQAEQNFNIVKDLTIEQNAGRWLEAWESVTE